MNSGGYARTTECASRVRLVLGGTPRAHREHCRCIFPSLKRQTERRCPIRREGRTTSLPGSATTRRTSRQPRPTAAGQFGGSPVPSNLCSPSRMTAPHRIGVRRWRRRALECLVIACLHAPYSTKRIAATSATAPNCVAREGLFACVLCGGLDLHSFGAAAVVPSGAPR